MRYLQMRFALCMSRAEGLCTPLAHSLTQNLMSGRSAAMNINLPTIFRYRERSAGPSFGSSFGTLDSHLTPGVLHTSAASHASTGQQTVKKFRKRLDLKPSLCLDQQLSKKLRPGLHRPYVCTYHLGQKIAKIINFELKLAIS